MKKLLTILCLCVVISSCSSKKLEPDDKITAPQYLEEPESTQPSPRT